MMGSDGRDCNNTVIGEGSVHLLVLRKKGRTDSTFVCSASWIHSNHAERVGPTADGGGIVGLKYLHETHSTGLPVWGTWDDLDRSHFKLNREGVISASRRDHLLAPRRAARLAPTRQGVDRVSPSTSPGCPAYSAG